MPFYFRLALRRKEPVIDRSSELRRYTILYTIAGTFAEWKKDKSLKVAMTSIFVPPEGDPKRAAKHFVALYTNGKGDLISCVESPVHIIATGTLPTPSKRKD